MFPSEQEALLTWLVQHVTDERCDSVTSVNKHDGSTFGPIHSDIYEMKSDRIKAVPCRQAYREMSRVWVLKFDILIVAI